MRVGVAFKAVGREEHECAVLWCLDDVDGGRCAAPFHGVHGDAASCGRGAVAAPVERSLDLVRMEILQLDAVTDKPAGAAVLAECGQLGAVLAKHQSAEHGAELMFVDGASCRGFADGVGGDCDYLHCHSSYCELRESDARVTRLCVQRAKRLSLGIHGQGRA